MSFSITASNAGITSSLLWQREKQTQRTTQSLERLSTGKRINRPSDDPAGFLAAHQLRTELTDLKATHNTYKQQDLSLRQQESRLANYQSQLYDLRGSTVQATGVQTSDGEKRALQQEIDATLESLDRLNGDVGSGNLAELSSAGSANAINGDGQLAAQIIEQESESAGLERASVAIQQRQLDVFERITEDQIVITTQTLSQIEDADFAEEASNLAGSQILTEAANVALVYSRQTHANQIGALLDEIDIPSGDSKD